MAGSLNKVLLIGRLGADPEIKQMVNGKSVARLSLATSQTWKDKNTGERKEKTEWHRIVVFNEGLVNVVQQYLKKGAQVYVEGQLTTRKWKDEQSGQDKYSTEIVIQGYNSSLTMLGGGNTGGGIQNDTTQQNNIEDSSQVSNDMDDEIPFLISMQKTEEPKDKNINLISMHDEMSSSYLSYAMSVIVSRALPDVRDGLKPVHRRILYAMYKGGYDWSKQFRKSARIVGDVIGKYHPHGDQSVYDALVRMVQDFSMSLPLVQGQGNFGSIDGDPAAAMRYTETRLSKVSQYLIDDIEKNTISFKSNYDETEKEPSVLPAQFPNLLVNGAGGIAVGMATSIPPHNLGEIIDGTLALIDNKDIKIKELMKHIPGPDFPTGGVIIGKDIIKQGYNNGRGSFKIRGEVSVESLKNGRDRLVITSIPYQVNKAVLNERIAQLVREKKIEGIKDIRDESNREGIRVAIDLRNGVEPETIKRQLYKNTQIESSFGFNTLAIVEGKPKTCTLKEFLSNFLSFREDVVIKKTKFDLQKAEERAHILIGLSVAVENLDKIIKIIRSSKTPEDAKNAILKTKWKINKSQKLISLVEGKKVKIFILYLNHKF